MQANPFLTSYRVGDLKALADRKMSVSDIAAATIAPVREPPPSPAVAAYVRSMDALLKEAQAL